MRKVDRLVALIFIEPTGLYHISAKDLGYLDARGKGYPTKMAAIMAAARLGYTHASGSGTYWRGERSIAHYMIRYKKVKLIN